MATKTIEIVLKIPARAVNSMKDSIRGSVEDAMMEELELEWDDFRDLISKDELNAFMAKHEARINKALVKDCASELKCFADEIDGSFWAGENTAFNFLTAAASKYARKVERADGDRIEEIQNKRKLTRLQAEAASLGYELAKV